MYGHQDFAVLVQHPLDNVDGGKLVVNLNQPAAKEADPAPKLAAQLTWTLLNEVKAITGTDDSPIRLKIESDVLDRHRGTPPVLDLDLSDLNVEA